MYCVDLLQKSRNFALSTVHDNLMESVRIADTKIQK
jgi:hypothetical protein